MEPLPSPLDLFHLFIEERDHRRHLEQGGCFKTKSVSISSELRIGARGRHLMHCSVMWNTALSLFSFFINVQIPLSYDKPAASTPILLAEAKLVACFFFPVALWKPNSSLTPGFNVGLPHGHNIVSRSRLQFAQAFVQLRGCGEVLNRVSDRGELEFEACLT